MTKRNDKKNAKKPLGSHDNDTTCGANQSLSGKDTGSTTEREVERRITAIKAMSNMESEHLLTRLRLIRSFFNEEQLKTPIMQFFKESLPNVAVVRNGDNGHCDLQWKDEIGNFSMYNTDGRDFHSSLLHRMSLAYPSCVDARQSLGGYQFSAKSVKTDLVGANDLEMGNYFSQEPFNSLMFGLPVGLQTPGVVSQRLSIGMTPKTLRLPKQGEMLLSVHGSPLGVYKEDNMDAIHESEEG